MRQLGTLAFYLFFVAAITGIVLYVFFETSVNGAYESVEYLTNDQWWFGGVMRSLHRYSSDGMVLTMALHLVREWSFDRYRGVRWYAWFTGVPVIWLLYVSGLSGYWLVWDELAQYVAIGSMEWIDWLGIFGKPVASNFLAEGSLTDRFFTLLVFMHIFAPLFLLFMMWIHVIRVTQPKINPPRGLAIGTTVALTVLSLVQPAISHAKANLDVIPTDLALDWFYMAFYPLFDIWGPAVLWGLAIGGSLFLAIMPWLPPMKLPKAAVVTLDMCNGCKRCYEDCPYGAITMVPRTDGLPYEQQAVVEPSMCTRCGICVGACPTSTPFRAEDELITGIDLVNLPLKAMRKSVDEALQNASDGIVLVGCDHGQKVDGIKGTAAVVLPCVSHMPPSFIDYMISQGAKGVLIAGCPDCGCRFRYGVQWMQDRLEGRRDPYLRKRVPRERIRTLWASPLDVELLHDTVAEFKADLDALPGGESADV
ncbi:hydrogenase iron-sulfur subunit [Magnetovibrio sp.]|uniref:hydrogenase iron-sulfur subunit n=1 Tax=Magnetovibrio sp. TaxID=2024836 RepID=UPI002F9425E5